MSTRALLTTTPTSETSPTPDMMMPNGSRKTVRPRKAPPKESTTEVRMIRGWDTELNMATRIRKISSRETTKALPRKSSDSFWNSFSPVNLRV